MIQGLIWYRIEMEMETDPLSLALPCLTSPGSPEAAKGGIIEK